MRASSLRPLQILVAIPAAVAMSAATTFERIPPDPSGEVVCPISSSRAGEVADLCTSRASGCKRGSAVYRPSMSVSRISCVGADEHRDLGGEEVVVAE